MYGWYTAGEPRVRSRQQVRKAVPALVSAATTPTLTGPAPAAS